MADDIIDRLENMWMEQEPKLTWADMEAITEEAAAEITRLRAENEKLHRETAIRIDQIEREQEAHLKTMADFNKQAEMNARLLTENASLRAENEKLEQQVAEFVNRFTEDMFVLRAENEKLRKAVAVERERCAKIADKFEGWSGSFVARAIRDADFEKRWEGDAAAAIRESGDELLS